jgi:hypothetical protein
MKHFISFQKRKALNLPAVLKEREGLNQVMAYQIQAEMFKYGFVFSKELFDELQYQSTQTLIEVYSDLCKGLREIVGTDGYEPIYRNFPQSVNNLSYMEFVVNAIGHYWSWGTWRPEDSEYINREFALETVKYKEIGLLTDKQFENIFTDIVYSGSSISKWDKQIVDWFIDNNLAPEVEFNKVSFKETKAYLGKRFLESGRDLPVKSATDVLRIYSAYSGGDEGLKEHTKFKNPTNAIKRSLLCTLDKCFDLEESFKTYREVWLRLLFYLNPLVAENRKKYPTLATFVDKLRNNPKSLKTFNSYVETYIKNKDGRIFELLNKRKGVFMRRLNQLYDVFGMNAIDHFILTRPSFEQLVNAYNYFSDRSQSKERAVVLANKSKSDMVTFGAQEALPVEIVEQIQSKLKLAMYFQVNRTDKKVYIDRSLYYTPLALNNRASSFSMSSKAIGTVEKLPVDMKTLRVYVHWVQKYDIDLSGFIITSDNQVEKVGWNGRHNYEKAVTYSGDNTGHSAKNAEYLDINFKELPKNVEWIVVDAKVYRGPNYSKWPEEGVLCGWMLRNYPEANKHWLPETIEHAMKMQSNSSSAYLCAIHVPTQNLVYLDLAQSNETIVTTNANAHKMRVFLEKFVVLDDGTVEVKWNKLQQGHILNLLSTNIVDNKDDAEIVFDENTTWETVARAMNEESLV